jgi:hypothetical protein
MDLKINVGQDFDSKSVIVSSDKTLKEAYESAGVPLSAGKIVTHNGNRLTDADFNKSLSELGAADGDYFTISGKLNSAHI